MEVRDYWDAIVRGWWLPVILGLVGLAVGLLVASPHKGHIEIHYQSTSVIGSPPTSQNGPSLIGGGLTIGQILYFASSDGVIAETSKLSGLNEPLPTESAGRRSRSLLRAGTRGQSDACTRTASSM